MEVSAVAIICGAAIALPFGRKPDSVLSAIELVREQVRWIVPTGAGLDDPIANCLAKQSASGADCRSRKEESGLPVDFNRYAGYISGVSQISRNAVH